MSNGVPEGYKEFADSNDVDLISENDGLTKADADLVKVAIKFYRKKGCKIFIAKDSWPGEKDKDTGKKKKERNADLIISCKSDRCVNFIVLIECKGGKGGTDSAVKQLEVTAKTAEKAKLIPEKIKKAQLKNCFHSVLFVSEKFEDTKNKVQTPGNETPFGDQKKMPELIKDGDKDNPLPSP